MRSFRLGRASALGVLALASAWLPLAMLTGCATSNSGASELPKKPTYHEDRAEDRVDEECPDCLGPGDSTIRQEEEE